jgi:glucose/sorbosone dehydrogenase
MRNEIRILSIALGMVACTALSASAQATLELRDFLEMPMTGLVDGKGTNDLLLSRVNTLREETGGAKRLFISDLNGPLYILDKDSKALKVYLDFNGNPGRNGIFRKLAVTQGYGNGLNGFYLDPDYARNGKFYTTHIEDPALAGSNLPDNTKLPSLNVAGYTTTAAIKTPGPLQHEGVLVEWTDSNPSNSTFEGTARELLRVQLNTRSHPLGDLIFNPAARPGDPDWRVLYIECGDGASGESTIVAIRSNPQRLDNLEGKILRIIPDLNEHATTSTVSENGRYRIPNDNPFVATPGARKEIWAYGFRNPHRLNWAIDPANPANNRLIANSVGLHTWETAYIVHKGANYGYALREGTELLKGDNTTAPVPAVDQIPLQIGESPTTTMVVPKYPVIQYGHDRGGGDSIGSGFVYNGKQIPALRGKYVFTDLTTGRIWYADYKDMLAADDGKAATVATLHPVRLLWNDPHDSPDAGKKVYDSMFPIVESAYHARGGKHPTLAGRPDLVMGGRADVRFSIDANGELFLYSKGDGVIRGVVEAIGF